MSHEAGRVFANRYRAQQLLKQAGGASTWLGADTSTADQVVIRVVDPSQVSLVAARYLTLAAKGLFELSSAQLTAFGTQGDTLFFVRPFFPGRPLGERLAAGPLSKGQTIAVARAALTALCEARRHGLPEAPLLSSNIICGPPGGTHQATLTDLGIGRQTHLESGAPRALESAGALIAGCLVPSLRLDTPLSSSSLTALKERGALGALAISLLLGEVTSPEQALAVLESSVESAGDLPLREPELIGRTGELVTLVETLTRSLKGGGGVVLVEGESGMGKTRLLAELAERVRQGCWVLRGQARDQASRPLELLEGVVAWLLKLAQADAQVAPALRQRLDFHLASLLSALPSLTPLFQDAGPAAAASNAPSLEQFGQVRTLAALTELLDALGSLGRPVVLVLDDCQWADDLSLRVLETWSQLRSVARTDERGAGVVLVASFRVEEVGEDHVLRKLSDVGRVVLRPLSEDEQQQVVRSMADALPPEVTAAVVSLSEGSPLSCGLVLQYFVESGVLLRGDDGWSADPALLASLRGSIREHVVTHRLAQLTSPDLKLLQAAAVLGKAFGVQLLAALAQRELAEVQRALEHAVRRRLVTWDAAPEGASFVHDKLREHVLQSLEPAARGDLHRRAARLLQEREPSRVFELAHHFEEGGELRAALPYALQAARQARSAQSLELAIRLYQLASRGAEEADAPTQRRIAESLGDVQMLAGHCDEAIVSLERARALSADDVGRAAIDAKLGEVHLKAGRAADAKAPLERALVTLGHPTLSPSLAGRLLQLLREILAQALHSLFPEWFLERRSAARAEREVVASRVYDRLPFFFWFLGGNELAAFWSHLRSINLAELCPPTPELVKAYGAHAIAMSFVPWPARACRFGLRALDACQSSGATYLNGYARGLYGIALLFAARFEESLRTCLQAHQELQRVGDRWESMSALHHAGWSLYRLGRLDEAREVSERVHRTYQELGDSQTSGHILELWAKTSGGRLPPGAIARERARGLGDKQTRQFVDQAEAVCLLAQGRSAEAAELLEATAAAVGKLGMRNEYCAPLAAWWLTALRLELSRAEGPQRRALLARVVRAQRLASALAGAFQNNLPHVLRESGLIAAELRQPAKARRLLERSLALATAHGAQYEAAQTLLARAQAGAKFGWPDATADAQLAARGLQGAGAKLALGSPWPRPAP